tara:strand:- start:4928 stop:5641 length:714 start_codon:yes stop_codon:yes gene_type:complete
VRNIRTIYTKELMGYFKSPMAYIFLVSFVLLNGYFFSNTFFLINQSDMRALFNIVPLVYLFFCPVVTMGLIARENNIGTAELIATLPIKDHEFVLGKYLAAVTLIAAGLAFTLVHFFSLLAVGSNIDIGANLGGYVGLLLVGAFYASIGTFASSTTDNQVIAFIVGALGVLVFYLLDKLLMFVPSTIAAAVQYLAVDYHLSNISRGVIDTRNLIYFGSMIWLFLALSVRTVEIRKWR